MLILFLYSIQLLGQPTGEERILNFRLTFTDETGNPIRFSNKIDNDTLYSIDKNYKILAYEKSYFLERNLLLDCFYENHYQVFTVNYFDYFKTIYKDSVHSKKINIYLDLINDKCIDSIINTNIYASYKRIGTDYYIPKNDLIIYFSRGNEIMIIYFEIYEIPISYYTYFDYTIPFKKGEYKIVDYTTPQMIPIDK